MDLTDEQWKLIEPHLPAPQRREGGRGRPRRDARDVLHGILWVLRTGAPWKELPPRYPPYQTCHRRLQEWVEIDTLKRTLISLARDLQKRGGIDDSEGFIDGTYVPAKCGGPAVGKSRAGKTTKIMALADGNGLPIAISIESGSRHDVALVDQTLDEAFLKYLPSRLIADKAFDAAPLEKRLLEERNVELIAPKRKTTATRKTDGRKMRRYKRRWKVERLFAWLKRFRRIGTRYERKSQNFLGFLQLGCILLLTRHF